jgi:hypothetical protein
MLIYLPILHVIKDEGQIRKDLEYYAGKIDPKDGPAISGILSVLYAQEIRTKHTILC